MHIAKCVCVYPQGYVDSQPRSLTLTMSTPQNIHPGYVVLTKPNEAVPKSCPLFMNEILRIFEHISYLSVDKYLSITVNNNFHRQGDAATKILDKRHFGLEAEVVQALACPV